MPGCPNPQCGVEISAGTRFCPECGTRVGGCRGCGYGLGGQEKFCPECGAAVLAGAKVPPWPAAMAPGGSGLASRPLFSVLLPPGVKLGRYRIGKPLGRGSFGMVFEAVHSPSGESVALKVVPCFGGAESVARRLAVEYENQRLISDREYLLDIHFPEYAVHGGLEWLLLPMARAVKSLRTWLDETRGDLEGRLEDGLEYLRQACRGVGSLHNAGIVHMDLKPENILLMGSGITPEASPEDERTPCGPAVLRVKVSGAGLTRHLRELDNANLVPGRMEALIPYCLAPERLTVARQKEVGPEADVYALGVMLYELLDGDPPFDGTADEVKRKHLKMPPPPITSGVPEYLVRVAVNCLEKDPGQRPPNAHELEKLLSQGLGWETALLKISPEVQAPSEAYVQSVQASLKTVTRAETTIETDRNRVPRPRDRCHLNAEGVWERRVQVEGVDFLFVYVPPGAFTMGSPRGVGHEDEQPRHPVEISTAFWLGKYPVTQKQWLAVMGANPSGFQKGDDYPVEQVSWIDSQEFLEQLNKRQNGSFRLPSEAEWEYACRAGSREDRYGPLDEIAWYDANSDKTTHPVGQKRPNRWGLFDILGNVQEWCQDWYDISYYSASPTVDPTGPAAGANRVYRGGCWGRGADVCRAAARLYRTPAGKGMTLGLRLVLQVG